jgi:uncharacterized protein DUF1707
MPDPQLRAADADREAVADRLAENMSAGRLSVAEYEDRVTLAYAAKTYGDLAELTRDLPAGRTAQRPAVQPATSGACGPWAGPRTGDSWHRAAWGSWLGTALIVTTIWLVTSLSAGAFLYFWPIWVIGPWGAVLFAQSLGGGPRARQHRHGTRY